MKFQRPPHTYVGHTHLLVQDLQRSLTFYQDIIGFRVLEEQANQITLTADGQTALLTIEQPAGVAAKEPRRAGLYHFAILLPTRSDLARALVHLLKSGYPLQGASDHLVSEAIYLADPDGNGIEIYRDRDDHDWKWQGDQVEMATAPLDAEGLLTETEGTAWNGLPKGTVMGHIHLHVANLQEAQTFYCDGLGFDVVAEYGSQALFISTGGYHHHIGLNVWNGIGAPAPSENSVGVKWFQLVFPTEEARSAALKGIEAVGGSVTVEGDTFITSDPSGTHIHLVVHH